MRPEEAQEQTEKRWAAIMSEQDDFPGCGWCMFAFLQSRPGVTDRCWLCPIYRLCGVSCCATDEFNEWAESGSGEAAQDIYDKLVANRDTLVQIGKEILNEQAIRHKSEEAGS